MSEQNVAERVLTFIRNTRGRHSTGELVRRFGGSHEEMRRALVVPLRQGLLRADVVDGRTFWTLT